jgi:hypothetical protein
MAREDLLAAGADLPPAVTAEQIAVAQLTRLRHWQPQIEQCLRSAVDREYRERWASRYRLLEIKRDQAALRFSKLEEL